jgi:hypothetical protein
MPLARVTLWERRDSVLSACLETELPRPYLTEVDFGRKRFRHTSQASLYAVPGEVGSLPGKRDKRVTW